MIVGAGLFVAGMLLSGTMTHLWQFYLYYGLVLAIAMAIFQVPLVAAVTLWFKKHLGIAMGALQALQGLGTVVGIVIVAVLLDSLGLKWTFWIPGIAGGAILIMLVRFFYNEPGEIGIKPWGALEDDPLERLLEASIAKARTSVFLKKAQKTGVFWNLIGIHVWGCPPWWMNEAFHEPKRRGCWWS
jgi:MFS family permease